jgi:diguanylate cyclase (GGDEF)-like protein
MKNTINAISQWLEALDRRILFVCFFLIVVILGYLDYLTGFEYSFSLFYLLPIGLAAWFIGRRSALILSVLSAITWDLSNAMAGQTYTRPIISFWNTVIRLGFFIIVTLLIASIRSALKREKELSSTDSLTGLMNLRMFYQQATGELMRAKRFNRPFTLAYIDIDNFKLINDNHGHMTGDLVLHSVADTMRTRLRRTDLIARIGGDEFAAFLPETEFTPGTMVISKLQEALLKAMDKHHWKVTFSIGAVTFYKFGEPLKDVIHQADEMMYRAKAGGKNTIRFDTVE